MTRSKKKWLRRCRKFCAIGVAEFYHKMSDKNLLLLYKAEHLAKKTGIPQAVDFSKIPPQWL